MRNVTWHLRTTQGVYGNPPGLETLRALVLSCTVLLCMLAHVFQLTWGLKHWRSLHEESHQAFQVLSGGCEQELFAHVPQSAQPYAPEAGGASAAQRGRSEEHT